MRFGLFGAAQAQRKQGPDVDSAAGFNDYIEYLIEAEALGGRVSSTSPLLFLASTA